MIVETREVNPPTAVAVVPQWSYWVPVFTAIILCIQTLGVAWIAQQNTATAESVEKVHVAVNSERTAMFEKLNELQERIAVLIGQKSKLEQFEIDRKVKGR